MPKNQCELQPSPIILYRSHLGDLSEAEIENLATYLCQMSFTHLLHSGMDLDAPFAKLRNVFSRYGLGLCLEVLDEKDLLAKTEAFSVLPVDGFVLPFCSETERLSIQNLYPRHFVLSGTSDFPRESNSSSQLYKALYTISPREMPDSPIEKIRNQYSYEDLFSYLRTILCYKLSISACPVFQCGEEIAQFDPCESIGDLQEQLLSFPTHFHFRRFVAELNSFYRSDFTFLNPCNICYGESKKHIFVSHLKENDPSLLTLINLSSEPACFPLDKNKHRLSAVFASDCNVMEQMQVTKDVFENHITVKLPRFSAVFLK